MKSSYADRMPLRRWIKISCLNSLFLTAHAMYLLVNNPPGVRSLKCFCHLVTHANEAGQRCKLRNLDKATM